MSESSSRSSWRPDQVCGTFVLPGAIGLLDRFSATTERLAQALHFFSLNEGQPSGWPSRALPARSAAAVVNYFGCSCCLI